MEKVTINNLLYKQHFQSTFLQKLAEDNVHTYVDGISHMWPRRELLFSWLLVVYIIYVAKSIS